MAKTSTPRPSQEALSESTPVDRLRALAHQDVKLARLVAANVMAPPDLLDELGHSADDATRKAVTGNPNAGMPTLFRIGSQFPEQLLCNPVLDLLLLENPNLLAAIPKGTLRRMLKRETVSPGFLRWAVEQGTVEDKLAALVNPKLTAELVARLAKDKAPQVAKTARGHQLFAGVGKRSDESVNRNSDLSGASTARCDWRAQFRVGVQAEMKTPSLAVRAEQLGLIVASMFPKKSRVNWDDELADQWVERFDEYSQMCQRVTATSRVNTCADDVLNVLNTSTFDDAVFGGGEEFAMWQAIALFGDNSYPQYPQTAREQFERLSIHWNARVVVEFLLEKTHWSVKEYSELGRVWMETLLRLARHKDAAVRMSLADNSNTPVVVLERLARDVGWKVAENPNTPVAVLERLAGDKDRDVRWKVAENPNTPVVVLERLVDDEDWWVREAVASNPNTPEAVLEHLARNKEAWARKSVVTATREALPVAVSGTKPSLHRLLALSHPECPVEALAKYYRSSSWLERCAIAQNPATPPNTVKKLTEDPHVAVSAAAVENLERRAEAATHNKKS